MSYLGMYRSYFDISLFLLKLDFLIFTRVTVKETRGCLGCSRGAAGRRGKREREGRRGCGRGDGRIGAHGRRRGGGGRRRRRRPMGA